MGFPSRPACLFTLLIVTKGEKESKQWHSCIQTASHFILWWVVWPEVGTGDWSSRRSRCCESSGAWLTCWQQQKTTPVALCTSAAALVHFTFQHKTSVFLVGGKAYALAHPYSWEQQWASPANTDTPDAWWGCWRTRIVPVEAGGCGWKPKPGYIHLPLLEENSLFVCFVFFLNAVGFIFLFRMGWGSLPLLLLFFWMLSIRIVVI